MLITRTIRILPTIATSLLIHNTGSCNYISDYHFIGERASVQIRAGAAYIYMYGGTYAIIVAHATHT